MSITASPVPFARRNRRRYGSTFAFGLGGDVALMGDVDGDAQTELVEGRYSSCPNAPATWRGQQLVSLAALCVGTPRGGPVR